MKLLGTWWWGGDSHRRQETCKREDRREVWRAVRTETGETLSPHCHTGSFIFGRVHFHPHCSSNSIIQFIPQWSYRVMVIWNSTLSSCLLWMVHLLDTVLFCPDEIFTCAIFWFLSKIKKIIPNTSRYPRRQCTTVGLTYTVVSKIALVDLPLKPNQRACSLYLQPEQGFYCVL